MNAVTVFTILLVASVVFGASSAFAQDDPEILLELALRAQNQIINQISDDSGDKAMFEEGAYHVDSLKQALQIGDVESAREHFLSAMKIFKELSKHITQDDSHTQDPTDTLNRLESFVANLKSIAQRHDASIDFSSIDKLFITASEHTRVGQYDAAHDTISEIKMRISLVDEELRDKASLQESERVISYAQQYLERLDRLIENAKDQGISYEIIEKLETAKENLSLAASPDEIRKEIKKIDLIKNELGFDDEIESKIFHVETMISKLAESNTNDPLLQDAQDSLDQIKMFISDDQLEKARQLLGDLVKQLTND